MTIFKALKFNFIYLINCKTKVSALEQLLQNLLLFLLLTPFSIQYIQRQKILQLIVLSLGVVPGNKIELTEYQWMDCYGQPCSPLIARREESGRRNEMNTVTQSRHLLSANDERKVSRSNC